MRLTEQQETVASAPVADILVSAAAGSGKTSVMTERITRRVLSGALDLSRILVMTFTDAAAANMRGKVEKALTEVLRTEVDPRRREIAARQLSILPGAHISTIHAFCLDIIRNFGYETKTPSGEIRIEPGFSTLDGAAGKILFDDAVDEVLSSFYELSVRLDENHTEGEIPVLEQIPEGGITPFDLLGSGCDRKSWLSDFQKMIASYGNSRGDLPLREMIASFHGYLRSLPHYEDWVREAVLDFRRNGLNFSDSPAAKTLMSDFITSLALAKEVLPDLENRLSAIRFVKEDGKNREYVRYFAERLRWVRELVREEEGGTLSWDLCVRVGRGMEPAKTVSRRQDDPKEKADFLERFLPVYEVIYYLTGQAPQSAKDEFRTQAQFLFGRDTGDLEADAREMTPVISRLFEIILLVDRTYGEKKREENAVDFSDYEHMALQLLSEPNVHRYYRDLFQEIYMDEYQDNSPIQEAIVSSFSQRNTFAVGDVKQSIYRFRHARPQIFMEKMKRYRGGDGGMLLEMNTNFRSAPCVISIVNSIFEQILSEASGEIEYDHTHRLFPSDERAEDREGRTELLLLDSSREQPEEETKDGEDGKEADKREKEAGMVIRRIHRLIREEGISPGDIAILCRTNDLARRYREWLSASGIPAEGGGQRDFFLKREILLMENLMRILDNFSQDIPLAAVMRADLPQTRFTLDEMMEIRLYRRDINPRRPFYESVRLYLRSGDNEILRRRVESFLDWVNDLRSRSMYLKVSVLIDEVYRQTDLKNTVTRFPDGEQRLRDLEIFRDWANRYETGRNKGLYRFVKYVEELRQKGASVADDEMSASSENTVHCLTIHKSKGLEFPFVFLVNLDRGIRARDTDDKLLLSGRFGIGADYLNVKEGFSYSTHGRLAVEAEERRANLAEELRLFYVALTRAEKCLFLCGTITPSKDYRLGRGTALLLSQAADIREKKLPDWLVQKARSYLDFSLLALSRHPDFAFDDLVGSREGRAVFSALSEDLPPILTVIEKLEAERTLSTSGRENAEEELESAPLSLCESLAGIRNDEERGGEEDGSHVGWPGDEEERRVYLSDRDRERLELQLGGTYPFRENLGYPAKVSVSELKRGFDDEAEAGPSVPSLLPPEDRLSSAGKKRPVNLCVQPVSGLLQSEKGVMTPASRGTLLHSLFRYIDFTVLEAEPTEEKLGEMLEEMVRRRMIDTGLYDEIHPFFPSVLAFSQSELCARMIAAEKKEGCGPFREIPFSLIQTIGKTEFTLVQGMIDCWFLEDGGAILLDYKSDRLSGSAQEKEMILKSRYFDQMEYYARAIRSAVKLPVAERHVWLIRDARSYTF